MSLHGLSRICRHGRGLCLSCYHHPCNECLKSSFCFGRDVS